MFQSNRLKRIKLFVPVLLILIPSFAMAEVDGNAVDIGEVVVTAPKTVEPLTVRTDPKSPQQPIPAHDGAEYLKVIPGFSIIRKGGTDGDPVFRGMTGSRLGILLDGQQIFGGCGGRMDPPTAYVFPQAYDRITVRKGPENVTLGPGYSAGVVLFEREIERFTKPDFKMNSSLTLGSFGRNDEVIDLRGGTPDFYLQGVFTRTNSDDYEDGKGHKVHSAYTRRSESAAIGWTPDDNTLAELSVGVSNGEAAYADRGMDGSKFDRQNFALKFEKRNLSPLFKKVETQLYYNYIDHVMDNYSLRHDPAPGMFSAMNPDRTTTGGRIAATLTPLKETEIVLGADTRRDVHTMRSTMMQDDGDAATRAYKKESRREDMRFEQYGLFCEATQHLNEENRLIGGLRVDFHEATDGRWNGAQKMPMPNPTNPANATLGDTDKKTLWSGFGRYERDFYSSGTFYLGLGHAERFADYWERQLSQEKEIKSVFLSVKPEKTTQLDTGVLWRSERWTGSVSGFYSKVEDYILTRWFPSPTQTRNIDATIYGLESDLAYKVFDNWKLGGTLAYVYGKNDTANKALAQQPPLEGRVTVNYDNGDFFFGALCRLVAAQNRYDKGFGNTVMMGADTGSTAGFGVVSLNGGWRLSKTFMLAVGVDNLFNKTYAEHLSRTGSPLEGYTVPENTRINEPGRTVWTKIDVAF